MRGWEEKRLGDIANIQMGQSPPGASYNTLGNGLPFFQGKAEFGKDYPTRVKWCSQPSRIAEKGDILLSVRAPVGPTNIAIEKCCIGRGLAAIRTNPKDCNQRYLRYYFRRFEDDIAARGVGSTFSAINRTDIERLKLPLPPLPEQERIVALLDEADELRKLRAQADRRSKELIPALFEEMFGDPIVNPKHWPIGPISSVVAELQGGRSINPAGAKESLGRFRVLKISAVTWGEYRYSESKPVPAGYHPPDSHFVKVGDLLFSRANTAELVGATTYVFETPPDLLLPDKLWRFVWKETSIVEPLYIWYVLQAKSVRREIGNRATGTGGSMKNISKPKVMSLNIPSPPFKLQTEFATRVSAIRALSTSQSSSRENLDAFFQSMLHRAFRGEL